MMNGNRGLRYRLKRIERQIGDQHGRLNEFHRILGQAIADRAKSNARHALGAYRRALEAHFELEERLLYPSISSIDPDKKPQLDRLCLSHDRFLHELAQLTDQLESSIDEFQRRFDSYRAYFALHEQQEESLITEIARSAEV